MVSKADIIDQIGVDHWTVFVNAAKDAFCRAGVDELRFDELQISDYLGTLEHPLVAGDAWCVSVSQDCNGEVLYYGHIFTNQSRKGEW